MMTRDRMLRATAYAATAACAGWLALALHPSILVDDAAITFRYVERFVAGHGWTYSDHERVMGFSNPLYTLLLSLLRLGYSDVETIARAIGIALFAIVAVQVSALTVRLSESLWGLLAGLLLPIDFFFRIQALSGMESLLAVSLGLAATHCFVTGRDRAAGVFLGLALVNKFDAAFLAFPAGLAWMAVRRQFPRRLVVTAAAIVLPWLLFAWWYYGSPIPHSLTAKLAAGSANPTNPFWVFGFFLTDRRSALLALALLAVIAFSMQPSSRVRATAWALAGWLIAHTLAYSFISLGDTYSWYLTVLEIPLIVLACSLPGLIGGSRWPRDYKVAGAAAAIAAVTWTSIPQLRATSDDLRAAAPIKEWEAFDADRRLAGIFLSQFADRNEIVEADFGWIAYEVSNPVFDGTKLNSETSPGPIVYTVVHGVPYKSGSNAPKAPDGFVPLATFDLASRLFPGYSWFVVYGRPDSAIAQKGRDLKVDVARLRDPRLIRAWQETH